MNVSNIEKIIEVGKKDMFWYSDCQQILEQIFGIDELYLVTRLLAATSINTSLKSNITLFRRAYYEIKNNKPFSNYFPNIKLQLERIKNCESLSGRKINNFANAMNGDTQAVVVDIWLLRAFDKDRQSMRHTGPHAGLMRSTGTTDKTYTQIETWVKEYAYYANLEPRQVGSMIWSGMRIMTNNDRQTHYKDFLLNTFTNLFNVI